MKISMIRTQNRISVHINDVNKKLAAMPADAHKFFKKETPKDTGNARNKTTLSSDTIQANYPYANRLDRGYSKQSPKGMSKPTLDYIRSQIRKILGR
jgi:hypothetical protein